jgi:hypothetical protein
MDRAQKISQLRQQLRQVEAARQAQLEVLMGLGPMIQGSFDTDARRCGKPYCHCVAGALHESKRLRRGHAGRRGAFHVPARDEVTVARKVAEYRRWRGACAALRRLAAQTTVLAAALQHALTEPSPVAVGAAVAADR